MVRGLTIFTIALLTVAVLVDAASQEPKGLRGDPAAVAMAEALLERVGGRDAWRRRTLVVEERGFRRCGETDQLTISRDFETGTRIIESRTATDATTEWLSPGGGWVRKNGQVTNLASEALAIDLQGLKQEPYAIYHRIARRDPRLRVHYRQDSAGLFVYDADENVLCWFQLDGKGGLTGWGNFYNGSINQHYYGPMADMGDVNMPKWGSASNGGFRFEYVSARLVDTALVEPSRTHH